MRKCARFCMEIFQYIKFTLQGTEAKVEENLNDVLYVFNMNKWEIIYTIQK